MEIKVIETPEAFSGIGEEYSRLTGTSSSLTPFYTYRWLVSWWRAHEAGNRVRIFCLYDGGRLILTVPLMFGKESYGKMKVQKASFLGGGWGLFNLPASTGASNWTEPFLSWLFEEKAQDWDLLQLGPLTSSSAQTKALIEGIERRGASYKVSEKGNPYIPLTGSWEEFLAGKSRNFRRTIKVKEKNMAEDGSFRYGWSTNPGADALKETVYEVSKRSWQGEKGLAVASTVEGRSFYELLAKEKNEFDTELSVLYSDSGCVAYLIGFVQGGVYHAFDTGFDPKFSDFSPGLAIHFYTLKELFGRNLEEFNLGYDHSYKDRFEPSNHTVCEIIAFRTRLIAGYGRLVDGARNLLKIGE